MANPPGDPPKKTAAKKSSIRARQAQLAIAIASGESIKAWASDNGVGIRTAYTWAKADAVRRDVDTIRRRLIDQAIGRLAAGVESAAIILRQLSISSESESIQLQASRAILADLLSVQSHAQLERRMSAIEEVLRDQRAAGTPRKG